LADSAANATRLQWASQPQGTAMSQHALVRGEVSFRAGDGMMLPIPPGPVEIDVADDSVTLGWSEDDGSRGTTAITTDEYERYVSEGKIRLEPA
jgi:hypothetical protein